MIFQHFTLKSSTTHRIRPEKREYQMQSTNIALALNSRVYYFSDSPSCCQNGAFKIFESFTFLWISAVCNISDGELRNSTLYCLSAAERKILSPLSVQTLGAHLGVGHGGQGPLDAGHGGGHRQQSRHPESDPRGHLAQRAWGDCVCRNWTLWVLPLCSRARMRTRRRPRSWSRGRRWWRCRTRAPERTRGPLWGRNTPRWPWLRRSTCWCCWPSWSLRAEKGWQQTAARPRLSKYRWGRF